MIVASGAWVADSWMSMFASIDAPGSAGAPPSTCLTLTVFRSRKHERYALVSDARLRPSSSSAIVLPLPVSPAEKRSLTW